MREPTRRFNQGSFIVKSKSLAKSNPNGVCSVLVAEWLAAGGSLGGASFSRRGGGEKTSARIAGGMANSRMTTLSEYGLFAMDGGSGTVDMTSDAWGTVVKVPGHYYYVKMSNDEEGHALGVVNEESRIRIFDPNHGEWDCADPMELELTLMGIAVHYMRSAQFDSIEVAPFSKPSLAGIGAALAATGH